MMGNFFFMQAGNASLLKFSPLTSSKAFSGRKRPNKRLFVGQTIISPREGRGGFFADETVAPIPLDRNLTDSEIFV